MPSSRQYFPPTMRMQAARDLFLKANGFTTEQYDAPTFTIGFGRIRLRLPNTNGRKRAVPFHDLHHILTGYGTDWIGEGEIGIWELRGGCNTLAAYYLNASGALLATGLSPRRAWRAFVAARGQRTLYRQTISYESVLRLTVGEVREKLGIPPDGVVVSHDYRYSA